MIAATDTRADTPWQRGRFDARGGPRKLLFGRMYEDPAIELGAFPRRGAVFCIASAGCTAAQLAAHHDVVAVDINPVQLAYARRRLAGAPASRGTAERVMGLGRALAPLVGWSRARVQAFLELDDPAAQLAFWRLHLDTRRFRATVDGLLSVTALRGVYAAPLLACLPARLGAVMRARLERGFARHSNLDNPYARALLLGELAPPLAVEAADTIELVHADAADYLERTPPGTFTGFTLSNILDGVTAGYRRRLIAAVRRAAAPDAVVVTRSFGEPATAREGDAAAADRSMIWGAVDARPASQLADAATGNHAER